MAELKAIERTNKQDARKLYFHILEASGRNKLIPKSHVLDFSHCHLILESMKEITKMNDQVKVT